MSPEQFVAFVVMSLAVSLVVRGWMLLRCIGLIFLWQWFTPVRPASVDLPLLFVYGFIAEVAFRRAQKILLLTSP